MRYKNLELKGWIQTYTGNRFKTFHLLPALGIIWDTQCAESFNDIKGYKELTFYCDFLWFGVGIYLTINNKK